MSSMTVYRNIKKLLRLRSDVVACREGRGAHKRGMLGDPRGLESGGSGSRERPENDCGPSEELSHGSQ